MPARKPVAILTYNGIDGACAAAAALLAKPKAELWVSSARRVGETFAELAERNLSAVHVCGLGVHCPWEELEAPARRLAKAAMRVYWHCGRGYLDERKAAFEGICTPVFVDAGTNAAAVAQYFGLAERLETQALLELAWFDPNVTTVREAAERNEDQAFWLDLIQAAISQYLKYHDSDTYLNVIRKLPAFQAGEADQALVETYRRTGYKYLLHGKTPAVLRLKERIQKCAEANRHIIVTGESGVGKEHVAHLIWERSARAMGPLAAVNCALYAGSASLANSDLFGHKKGAFTGAHQDRAGKFAETDGGILFLDELAELPLEVQAKLLRVLEDGRVMPEGSDRYERVVDVLIIAATNRDLTRRIREGAFRADLYHRLATLRLHVPPLRERLEDMGAIVHQRLSLLAAEGHERQLGKRDWEALHGYDWPGNVRQLIKIIERAVLLDLSIPEVIDEERALGDLRETPEGAGHESSWLPKRPEDIRPLEEVEKDYAQAAWKLHGGNYTATAKALGIAANTLRYKYLDGAG